MLYLGSLVLFTIELNNILHIFFFFKVKIYSVLAYILFIIFYLTVYNYLHAFPFFKKFINWLFEENPNYHKPEIFKIDYYDFQLWTQTRNFNEKEDDEATNKESLGFMKFLE